ncbi:MAG: ATPase [gamma proteobacterium symbiont of Taylorina sp.]|nr:ATPase [gamma proteobacterium symbiont of Taylorina sp.]
MENVLQRLLDAELKAQAIVENAKNERDQLVSEAREEVKRAEQRFELRIPEIYSAFTDKAEERAKTQINELERRYQERRQLLTELSKQHQKQAVADVLDLLLNVEKN